MLFQAHGCEITHLTNTLIWTQCTKCIPPLISCFHRLQRLDSIIMVVQKQGMNV